MDERTPTDPHDLLRRVKRKGLRRRLSAATAVVAVLVAVPVFALADDDPGQPVATTPGTEVTTTTTSLQPATPTLEIAGPRVRGAEVEVEVRGVPADVKELDLAVTLPDGPAMIGVGTATVADGTARTRITVPHQLSRDGDLVGLQVGGTYVVTASTRPGGAPVASADITIGAATTDTDYHTQSFCGTVYLDGPWDLGSGRDDERIRTGIFRLEPEATSASFTDEDGKRFVAHRHDGPVDGPPCPSS